MKKALTLGIVSLGVLFSIPGISHAERIKDFSSEITINNDATVQVVETIKYDFESASRHGIFRDIPLDNSDGSSLEIGNISVVDEQGNDYQKSVSEGRDGIHIKIGDPKKYVSGVKTYKISYLVKNSLVSFDAYDELYWDVTGNGWDMPIDRVSTVVRSPQIIQESCYQGAQGSTTPCDTLREAKELEDGEGVTLAVGFQKGVVAGITRIGGQINTTKQASKNQELYQVLVLVIGGVSLIGTFLYWRRNRDPKSNNPVVAWYESPNGLEPLVVGTLIDKTTDFRDITAQILSLASRGYLSLTRTEEKTLMLFTNVDYLFTVTKNTGDLSFDGDKKVLELLFGVTSPDVGVAMLMSELEVSSRTRIQMVLSEIKNITKSFLKNEGYLETAKKPWWTYVIGIGFIVLGYGSFIFVGETGGLSFILIPIVVICVFIWLTTKTKYTQRGADIKQLVLGFKEFLSVTDKERFEFHNAPEKNPTQFMEFLPYAIAFGVEKKWAEQFKDMVIPSPSWYHSNTNTFVAMNLVSHLQGMSSSFASAATPASSGSGGSGSSGGGSGGGGGGSW